MKIRTRPPVAPGHYMQASRTAPVLARFGPGRIGSTIHTCNAYLLCNISKHHYENLVNSRPEQIQTRLSKKVGDGAQ
jgi:hypothetical protein